MTRRKPPIFLVALGSAIALHALALGTAPEIHLRYSEFAPVRVSRGSAYDRPLEISLEPSASPFEKQAEEPAEPDTAPPPAEPPKPPTPDLQKPDVADFPDRIGEKTGQGIGTHRSEGDKPLLARAGKNDQAFLDRDPRGPGLMPSLPSPSTLLPGTGGQGPAKPPAPEQKPAVVAPIAPPVQRHPEKVATGTYRPGPIDVRMPTAENGEETDARKVDPTAPLTGAFATALDGSPPFLQPAEQSPRSVTIQNNGLLPPPLPARLASSPPPAPLPLRMPESIAIAPVNPEVPMPAVAAAPPVDSVNGGKPGIPVPPAGAAQQSESESDAFSRLETVVRRDGSLEPQFGRKVKTRRPKITVSGMVDAALGARSVTMKVRINPDGTVANVSVTQSSGSNELDTPCVVSMYEWWFEPLTDRTGKAIPDTVFFTINFR